MMKMKELYDLNHTMARKFLEQFEYPWQALDGIGQMILDLASNLDDEYEQIADQVWVHKSTQIAKTANLNGPCIIGAKTEVRPGAFIRGNALVGENCVVGNSTELKNVILLIMFRFRTITMLVIQFSGIMLIWELDPSLPMSKVTNHSW